MNGIQKIAADLTLHGLLKLAAPLSQAKPIRPPAVSQPVKHPVLHSDELSRLPLRSEGTHRPAYVKDKFPSVEQAAPHAPAYNTYKKQPFNNPTVSPEAMDRLAWLKRQRAIAWNGAGIQRGPKAQYFGELHEAYDKLFQGALSQSYGDTDPSRKVVLPHRIAQDIADRYGRYQQRAGVQSSNKTQQPEYRVDMVDEGIAIKPLASQQGKDWLSVLGGATGNSQP